jgi:hypothetical protein
MTLNLGTFSLNLLLATFFVFLTRKPHLLERTDTGQYRAADPRAKTSFGTSIGTDHLESHTVRDFNGEISVQTLRESLETK